jgi:glycosyltransferase involved in cell wall biosynthesis
MSSADHSLLRTLVIVPAHNEAGSIQRVLADLRAFAPRADVVVVDDHSEDNTAELARSAGAIVLQMPCNVGVGGAVQTGYQFAKLRGYDLAVQFDGDAQHRANQIAALVAPIIAGRADLTVGSRLVDGTRFRFHPLRFLGSRLLARLVSLIVGRKITDPTSGFRAAGKRAINFFAAHYPQTYLADTTEALVWAGRQGMEIAEVPVRMRQRTAGVSATGSLRGLGHVLRITLALLVDCIEPRIDESEATG